MAHRFIVGETPAAAPSGHARAVGATASRRRSTCSARRRSPPPRPTATPRAAREALDALADVYATPPRRRAARARRRGPARRARTSRSRSRRSRRCCAPTRPSSASATPRRGCASCCAAPSELGAHLHIDMESFDSREAITDLVLELLAEDEFRDGPSRRHRPAGLPARLARAAASGSLAWAAQTPRAHPLSSGSSRAPTGTTRSSRPRQHGWERAGLRGQGRLATATSRR